MFDFLFREKVFETTDPEQKFEIGLKLKEKEIDYIIKKEDVSHRNMFDTMKTGSLGLKSKFVYSFWVKKDQAAYATRLINRGI